MCIQSTGPWGQGTFYSRQSDALVFETVGALAFFVTNFCRYRKAETVWNGIPFVLFLFDSYIGRCGLFENKKREKIF